VAAQVGSDSTVKVRTEKGGFGELRVCVDGRDVLDTSRLWYPTPSSVVAKIQAYLRDSTPQ